MLDRNQRIGLCSINEEQIKSYIQKKQNEINEDSILLFEGEDFVKACYGFFLEREGDKGGISANLGLLNDGMSKEGFLYYFSTTKEFNHRFQLGKENFYKKEYLKYHWDISDVFQYEGLEFIWNCYDRILEREPDLGGVKTFTRLYAEGMPKEGIVYLIASSEEGKRTKTIRNIDKFEKAYEAYIRHKDGFSDKLYSIEKEILINQAVLFLKLNEMEKQQVMVLDFMNRNYGDTKDIKQGMDENWEIIRSHMSSSDNVMSSLKSDIHNMESVLSDQGNDIQNMMVNSKTVVAGYKGGVNCVQVGKFLMGVPSQEWRLAMFLSRYGAFEPGTEKCFNRLIEKDMTVIDVGANLGIYTLHALSRGCNVYSFEPTPETFYLLRENVQLNGFMELPNHHLFNSAVGAESGECEFTEYSDVCGHNSIFGELSEHAKRIKVPLTTLDDQIEPKTKVGMIKIDVEGAEPMVIEGMQRILKDNPEIFIIMEFAPEIIIKTGYTPESILNKIENLGFRYYKINEPNGETITVSHKELLHEVSVNLLLTRKDLHRNRNGAEC